MSNLLLDETIQANIETIVGEVDDLWLNVAWEQLTNDLGYDPSSSEVTEAYFGTNTKFLYLDKRPVTELSSISINGYEQDIDDYSIYNSCAVESPYPFSIGYNKLKPTLSYEMGVNRIEVTYTGGYSADDFPYSLQLAVGMMLNSLQSAINNGTNLNSYSIGDISYAFKSYTETNAEYNSILDKYRGF